MSAENALLEARALQIAAAGELDIDYEGVVSSPCVNVCKMTPDRSYCEGCFRALDDIRIWSKSDASIRRLIWLSALERAGITLPAVTSKAVS